MIVWFWDKQRPLANIKIEDPKSVIPLVPTMASFNPYDPSSLVVTGKGVYRYYKIIDNQTIKCTVSQLTKKDMGFSNLYTAHTWTDDRLILYTDMGEILLVEKDGDFKMMLKESPGEQFSIRYAINSRPNGFVIANTTGRYMVYEEIGDPKCPYRMAKSLVSACLLY